MHIQLHLKWTAWIHKRMIRMSCTRHRPLGSCMTTNQAESSHGVCVGTARSRLIRGCLVSSISSFPIYFRITVLQLSLALMNNPQELQKICYLYLQTTIHLWRFADWFNRLSFFFPVLDSIFGSFLSTQMIYWHFPSKIVPSHHSMNQPNTLRPSQIYKGHGTPPDPSCSAEWCFCGFCQIQALFWGFLVGWKGPNMLLFLQ